MKVFISWSGDLSHKLAEAFHAWLPAALQTVRPYFTPADIEKGARWGSEIAKELESADVGILFVTRDNIGSAWLLYEAGALSKRLEKSRVCPMIFGLTHGDLPGPLRQLQATEFKEEDVKKLLKTINSTAADNRLADTVLDEVFEIWWPRLESKIQPILESTAPKEESPLRTDRELIEETLELVRLAYKKSARSSEIPPELVSDLVKYIRLTANSILEEHNDPQASLTALSKIRGIARYLLRRVRFTDETERTKLSLELGPIVFEYSPPDLDDEIPF